MGGHAANVRAIMEMIFVARPRTLNEGDFFGRTIVGRPKDRAVCRTIGRCEAFHLHVGNAVFDRARAQVGQIRHVVRLPSGGDDDGSNAQSNGLFFLGQIEIITFLDFALVRVAQAGLVHNIALRKSKRRIHVNGLARCQTELVVIDHFCGKIVAQIGKIRAAGTSVAWFDLYRNFIISNGSVYLGHFGQSKKLDRKSVV